MAATALLCGTDTYGQGRLQELLPLCGVQTVWLSKDLETAGELAERHQPDLILLEVWQLQAASGRFDQLRACCPAPLILLGGEQELGLLQNYAAQADALLLTPLPVVRAAAQVQIALISARCTNALRKALDQSRTALKERKQIEQAKGLVMLSEELSEEQAYRHMRSQAMGRRISMARLAEEILRQGGVIAGRPGWP
ncbi:MAG: ANTAR domain-containing protein [Geobacter sp.]|nr:ANTAR domain-containing protein [Geobacter sp.]